MEAISHFIASLENWNKSFTITEYDYQNHQCEIATMFDLQLHNQEEFISYTSYIYANAIKSGRFTLKHPLFNEIICQMVYSFSPKDIDWGANTHAFVNFCFFIDESNQFPFLLLQVHHFFDVLVVEDKLIHFPHSPAFLKNRLRDVFAHFRNIDIAELYFQEKPFAFTLEQWRPFHFMIEILNGIYEIHCQSQGIIPIGRASSFFSPSFCEVKVEAEIFIRPVICPMGLKYRDLIMQESLSQFNHLVAKEDIMDSFDKENLSSREIEHLMFQYGAANV